MSNLLFFRRSCAYRHAARLELRKARALPRGPARNQVLLLAKALRDLARDEAWLEGQTPRLHRLATGYATAATSMERLPSAIARNYIRQVNVSRAAGVPGRQSGD
jgi:hypothetical protein